MKPPEPILRITSKAIQSTITPTLHPRLSIPNMTTMVRVGAVQAEPVWLDLDGSVDKTISLIRKASADGVQVLGFPEVWIPGYPW